ncbi:MAG: HypC/HybG/HupF family hydrogenase formation chaperone [Cyanobacteria bacterium PR.3.49]|jgi:hydrogenase expression/formation protein HypC|nr:HypC/HybG/HupF family hydrogenase formation chaperone [Cyanobacteria bacterium PR.3.49]
MCITLPTKVLSVTGKTAVVDWAGQPREIFLPFESVQAGEWVLTYAGAALCVVEEEQALETLALLMNKHKSN